MTMGVGESFFSLLETERINQKIYLTRNEVRADIFNWNRVFNNPRSDAMQVTMTCRRSCMRSSIFEKLSGVEKTSGLPRVN